MEARKYDMRAIRELRAQEGETKTGESSVCFHIWVFFGGERTKRNDKMAYMAGEHVFFARMAQQQLNRKGKDAKSGCEGVWNARQGWNVCERGKGRRECEAGEFSFNKRKRMKGSPAGGGGYVCLMIPRERTGKELVIERAILEQVFQFRSCFVPTGPPSQFAGVNITIGALSGRAERERETDLKNDSRGSDGRGSVSAVLRGDGRGNRSDPVDMARVRTCAVRIPQGSVIPSSARVVTPAHAD
jgi:hypothetical protein